MSAVKTKVLSEEQFAKEVGWHRESIARMRRNGEIDHCKEGRKVWYLSPDHVESFHRRFEKKIAA
jgi:DNA-binding transcriptional regulator PaaX